MELLIVGASVVCLYLFRREVMSIYSPFIKYVINRLTQKKLKKVIYVDTTWECDEIIGRYFMQHKVLGLDCEWVTIGSHQKPVSLLQIASPDGVCAIFRMPKLYQYNGYTYPKKAVPSSLLNLLSYCEIVKVGVAIENDAKYLARDYNVPVSGWMDLRHIAEDNGVLARGLAYLAQETVGIVLDKKFNVRVSNWDADVLTEEQIHYAAMDAHAAISIFTHFVALKQSLFRLLLPLSYAVYDRYMSQADVCYYLDMPFKYHHQSGQASSSNTTRATPITGSKKFYSTYRPGLDYHTLGVVPESNPARKGFQPGKLYDNCYLLDTMDQVLCTCDRKKAQWYLDKELAVLVRDTPFTVRLLFQPSGFDRADCAYYAEEKRNQCVVCGSEDPHSLVKKYIVPHEYRKHFPDYMKDRRSHDVLLMCWRCHKRSNVQDQTLRHALATRCHAPLSSKSNKPVTTDAHIRKVKSAAQTLLRHEKTNQLPPNRLLELRRIVIDHYSAHPDWFFSRMVHEAASLCDTIDNAAFVSHGQAVVRHFAQRGHLGEFETEWRQHFLATMQPRHLPPHWSLHHNYGRRNKKSGDGTGPSYSTAAGSDPSSSMAAEFSPSSSTAARSSPSSSNTARSGSSSSTAASFNLSSSTAARSDPRSSTAARSGPSSSTVARFNPSSSTAAKSGPSSSSSDNERGWEGTGTIFERFHYGDKKPLAPGVFID